MSTFAALGGKIDQEGGFKFLAQMFRQGYVLGMNVTQRGAGANMSVDINIDSTTSMAGANFLTSANVPYYGWTDAITNLVVSTSDPANPRLDVVVAYIDLSLITSTVTNNNGALKFKDVTGTPAGGPTAPNSAAIQSSVGAGNPWVSLGQLAVAANATSVVTANITDTRLPAAYRGGYLYGGASNTKGHLVPNVADDTIALLAAVQTLTNKTLGSTNSVSNAAMALSVSGAGATNSGSAGGTTNYVNLGSLKICWGQTAALSPSANAMATGSIVFPLTYTTAPVFIGALVDIQNDARVTYVMPSGVASTTAATIGVYYYNSGGTPNAKVGWLAIGN